MEFIRTEVHGAVLVRPEPHRDERGWLSRVFCVDEFERQGMATAVSQINLAETRRAGTVRGLHYQLSPAAEAKLVRCVTGAVFDVVVDTRQGSPTFGQWAGVELTADEGMALYLPPGCGHGYQALADSARVLYHASAPYTPELERGVHHADPHLDITWPLTPVEVSDKDRALPFLADVAPSQLPPMPK